MFYMILKKLFQQKRGEKSCTMCLEKCITQSPSLSVSAAAVGATKAFHFSLALAKQMSYSSV